MFSWFGSNRTANSQIQEIWQGRTEPEPNYKNIKPDGTRGGGVGIGRGKIGLFGDPSIGSNGMPATAMRLIFVIRPVSAKKECTTATRVPLANSDAYKSKNHISTRGIHGALRRGLPVIDVQKHPGTAMIERDPPMGPNNKLDLSVHSGVLLTSK